LGGDLNINVDVAGAISPLVSKIASWFGKDAQTRESISWLTEIQRLSYLEASTVQCIGMYRPVPIKEIYQPTRLSVGEFGSIKYVYSIPQFLGESNNSIIKAGPGYGKTTFLHYVYITHAESEKTLPVLFSLKRASAVDDLKTFVDLCDSTSKAIRNKNLLLLVDGYDEVPTNAQKEVSEALERFETLRVGKYLLTCRRYYEIFYLKTRIVTIDAFSYEDQVRFMESFLHVYGADVKAATVVEELRNRGLDGFLSHPLLLALVCIVRSNPGNTLGSTVLELASTAVDTLSWKWDLEKGVARHATTPLSGKARVDLLCWLAFKLKDRSTTNNRAVNLCDSYLRRLRWKDVDARQALMETAKFYGIVVPFATGWTFVHKVLHDYLAARYWVSTGQFNPTAQTSWDTRAAYAACLQPDATKAIIKALRCKRFASFAEILLNQPAFDQKVIAVSFLRALAASAELGKIGLGYLNRDLINMLIRQAFIRKAEFWPFIPRLLIELKYRGERLDPSTYQLCIADVDEDEIFQAEYQGSSCSITLRELTPKVFQ
jgi:hypothetical protein